MSERASIRAVQAPATKVDLEYITETRRLTEQYAAIKAAHPGWAPYEILKRAQKVVDDEGRGLEDPERLELHRMAMDWSRDHPGADYRQALLAVSREYEARVAPRIEAARIAAAEKFQTVARTSVDDQLMWQPSSMAEEQAKKNANDESAALDARAQKYMTEHPGTKYREALLAVSAAEISGKQLPVDVVTIKTPPYPAPGSAAQEDLETHTPLPTVAEIEAYAKKKGLTYPMAKIALARIFAGLDPEGGFE